MVTDNRSSGVVDPLESYSGLALFPKTFQVSPDVSNSFDFDGQLQALHNHLKSMALRSPDKLREQAKKILDGSSKSLNSKFMSDQPSMDKNEAFAAIPEVNARERRPALNRKRARFSLKPDSSQPVVRSEPTLDIKKLKDPEEFFMAYERHENAKREIQRQMGGIPSDSEEHNPSLVERPRRPGLLGHDRRRSIKYKHLYSSEDSETNKNSSAQEINDSSILSPVHHSSQQDTEHVFTSEETELAGSMSKEENKVSDILSQLLSYNSEDLDEDGTLNILQEHLQIKPVELEELQLPDFQDIRKIDLKSSRSGKLPRRSHILSDVDTNLLKVRSTKTPTKHRLGAESPISYVASPTPPKNPFASLSLLNQRILRSSVSDDPFSAHDIDQPVRNSSFIASLNKESDLADGRTQSKENVFENGNNIEVVKTGTRKQDGDLNVGSSASHVAVDNNIMNNDMDDQDMNNEVYEHNTDGDAQANGTKVEDDQGMNNEVCKHDTDGDAQANGTNVEDDQGMNNEVCEHDTDGDAQANGTNVEDNVQVEDPLQETLSPVQTGLTTVDNLNSTQSYLDYPSTAPSQDQVRDRNFKIPENGSEQHTEIEEEQPEMPLNKKRKAKTQSQKEPKRREISGRKSLGGAGTKWESGVRRSTRIRCRPLEFWKGERLLYGRIHKSLPTVIGLKYASPGKGDRTLKVRSYVSEEHKELVELAGLH